MSTQKHSWHQFNILSTDHECPQMLLSVCWRNTWTEGELLEDLYDMFQIITICFSFMIRNIFWGVGAAFKEIMAWFRKKFIGLLLISSILQQYLLYVSTLPPPPFKVSACQHFGFDPPPPLQSVSSVSILAQTPHPPKPADVILECSLNNGNGVIPSLKYRR